MSAHISRLTLVVAALSLLMACSDEASPGSDTTAGLDTTQDVATGADTSPDMPWSDTLDTTATNDTSADDTATNADLASADTTTTDTVIPDDPPAPTELSGWIRVIEQVYEDASDTYSMVDVMLWAAPLPTTQEPVDEEGDCVLLDGARMVGWLCEPACEWGQAACIDDVCVPYPAPAPSGDMTIEGLEAPVTLTPAANGQYTVSALPDDLFTPGATVHLTSSGGDTPALDLLAKGVEDLEVDFSGYQFVPGEDATISWTPGSDPDARIQVLLNTGWHGSTSMTTIWCETDDDGELTIPASLTAQFDIPSCGECEGSYIRRFTRAVVDFGQGPIELMVASQVWFVAWWW